MNGELTNIYFLTKEELTSLQEDIYILLEEFIKNDPLCIGKENFDDIFMNNIHTILSEQLQELNTNHNLQNIITKLEPIHDVNMLSYLNLRSHTIRIFTNVQ